MKPCHAFAAFALLALATAVPSAAQQSAFEVEYCQKLEKQATELMDTWRYRVEEISNDPYDDKLRRLRDSYDMIHYRLESIRDDARHRGCTGLPEAIETAFKEWERP